MHLATILNTVQADHYIYIYTYEKKFHIRIMTWIINLD